MDPALDQVPAEQAGSGADPVGWAVFPGGAAADSHLGVVFMELLSSSQLKIKMLCKC